jgi:hypothetical protein
MNEFPLAPDLRENAGKKTAFDIFLRQDGIDLAQPFHRKSRAFPGHSSLPCFSAAKPSPYRLFEKPAFPAPSLGAP